jgi:raffinose/stachyose/melibiose transport system permease protein
MAVTQGIAPVSRRRRARRSHSVSNATLVYVIPALVFYVFVLVVPTLRGATLAFTDWNGLDATFNFVWFDNFAKVLTSPASLGAIIVTLTIAFFYTIFVNLLGLLLALGVHSQIKSRNLLRVFLFAPAVMTPVVTAYLWKYILSPTGPLNLLLDSLGLGGLKQSWLGTPEWALFSIILVLVWQFSGYHMVIFLAGLQGIPHELLEASAVDGAGPIRKFWSIVRPLLAPAITINLMLSIIGGLKVFDQVWVMTGGGPGGSTHTLSTLLYRDAFQYGEFGSSIAMAIVLTLLVALISGIQYRSLLKQEAKN